MIVGTLTIEILIYQSQTLKDKRRVLKSILDRIRSKFNVSIAEVDQQDIWQRSVLGIACVSNQTVHVHSILNNVIKFIDTQESTEIISVETEIL
ncbi:MAG: DUF503 domain-containing protein [Desulfotomaculum sp.]|nr:DUF503 domain-containing protein [Desulfotomaculum sp.]